FQEPGHLRHLVKNPLLSREGANLAMYYDNELIYNTEHQYGGKGYNYLVVTNLHREASSLSNVCSWFSCYEACGISFRESDMPITTDKSRFIPHIIRH